MYLHASVCVCVWFVWCQCEHLSLVFFFFRIVQENVAAESSMMVPDCQRRLEVAVADLQSTVDECDDGGEELDEQGIALLGAAREILLAE